MATYLQTLASSGENGAVLSVLCSSQGTGPNPLGHGGGIVKCQQVSKKEIQRVLWMELACLVSVALNRS